MTDGRQMILHPDVRTAYEWRRPDGSALRSAVALPGSLVSVVIEEDDGPTPPPYDLHAREDGGARHLIYEVRRGPNDTIEVIRPEGRTA